MIPFAGRVTRVLLGAAMLAGVTADDVGAQMGVPGGTGQTGMPSPAVFGGARREQPGENNLTFSADALAGYDTNILADNAGVGGGTGGGLGSSEQTASTFAGGGAFLQWSQNRPRVSYYGGLGASYRTFFDISDFDVQSYDASAGVGVQLTRRSGLSLGVSVGVQPFYQFGVFGGAAYVPDQPGDIPAFSPDFLAAREQVLRFGGSASYQYQFSERTAFTASVGRNGFRTLNDEAEASGLANLGSTNASARITRRLTTNLGLRLGYGYWQFDQVQRAIGPDDQLTATEQVGMHNIDVGLDYARALTLARRTYFSFGTGTTITQGSNPGVGQGTNVNITGFATLQREFLRTWAAALNYTRGTNYLEGYNQFVVFDTASASVGGLFTDRVDASATVFYTNGTFGGGGGGTGNDRLATIGAGAQIRYGFSENWALFASYTYARFEIPTYLEPVELLTPYSPGRQGVRVGLTVWFDLLR